MLRSNFLRSLLAAPASLLGFRKEPEQLTIPCTFKDDDWEICLPGPEYSIKMRVAAEPSGKLRVIMAWNVAKQ